MLKLLCCLLLSLWSGVAFSFVHPWDEIEDIKFESLLKRLVYTKRGYITTGLVSDGYKRYMGVPYGLVNTSNPFGPSTPYPDFEETFYAENEGIACPQIKNGIPAGIIQCLTLNIYVPENTAVPSLPLPVMVWIHEGAFVGGSAEDEANNPTALLRHDIIVVAVNYRLGIYGFMCLDTPEVPGNQGLKDQTLALRWIRDNIAAFGGDENKITVVGQSAGGMSVNMHLFSMNEKLFDQAIIQSGPALSYWMIVESNNTIPLAIAKQFGYETTDVHKALNYLSSIDTHSLVRAANDLKITNAYDTDQPLTKPCVEKQFEGVDNFITEHPMNMISKKAKDIPIIIGHNANEYYFQCHGQDDIFFESYDLRNVFELGFNTGTDFNEALNAVKHFYFGDGHIEKNAATKLIDFGTDFIFAHPTQRMAEKLLESGAKNVYRYVFSFFEASHGDELPYLFDSLVSELNKTDGGLFWKERLQVKHRMVKLWTNFVKHGNPTPEPTVFLPFVWTPISNTTHPYLEIDIDLKMKSRREHRAMAFWDLFYKLYGKFQKWYIKEDKEQQLRRENQLVLLNKKQSFLYLRTSVTNSLGMWSVVWFISLYGLAYGASRLDPLVSTKAGLIRGLQFGDGYAKFLGVPYAVVDANNPFGPSVPHQGFDDTFEAYESKACPHTQFNTNTAVGTLDCLTVDIYVPSTANSRNRLPVMVWIHGGAFIGGSNRDEANEPVSLLKHDVIVVAVNYRLGIYGFMCLDIPEVPGNQGLKDQTLALRWVRDNIAAFGGDENKITIFGESAGGMSVNMHLFSLNEKLFDQAIIQSGPALSYWMMVESNNTIPSRLAEELGFVTSDINEALKYLATVDPHLLVQVARDLKISSGSGTDQPLTKPCVEKEFEGVENFITEHPMNMKAPKVSRTPIIIGNTAREFFFQYAYQDEEFFESFDIKTLFEMGFNVDSDFEEAIDEVRHFYFGDEKIQQNLVEELIDFGTDLIFGHSTQRMAEKLLESGAEKVYRFIFSYREASHGDDLGYVFDSTFGRSEEEPDIEKESVKNRFVKLWTNFAKYG
ncbi:hypothetical protein HF086_013564 [Spodoptera exigua]|uniref:Carboxylesterase type B domain-containing protein n=1 Tax=Spodoptera exigua TaxID=7107 RepID=A0A922MU54_SPOEX|nr:hypothetical protein HF086_013564 [Spodoptera exigua]